MLGKEDRPDFPEVFLSLGAVFWIVVCAYQFAPVHRSKSAASDSLAELSEEPWIPTVDDFMTKRSDDSSIHLITCLSQDHLESLTDHRGSSPTNRCPTYVVRQCQGIPGPRQLANLSRIAWKVDGNRSGRFNRNSGESHLASLLPIRYVVRRKRSPRSHSRPHLSQVFLGLLGLIRVVISQNQVSPVGRRQVAGTNSGGKLVYKPILSTVRDFSSQVVEAIHLMTVSGQSSFKTFTDHAGHQLRLSEAHFAVDRSYAVAMVGRRMIEHKRT